MSRSRRCSISIASLAVVLGCGGGSDGAGPAQVNQLAIQGGDGQSATVGTTVAIAPSVKVTNSSGAAVAGVAVTFAVASGSGTITGGAQTSNGAGVATVGGWTLGTVAGANTMTASITGAPSLTLSATGIAAAPSVAMKEAGDAQTANARTSLPVRPAVKVTDAFNNPVSGVAVTFAATAGGGSVSGGTQSTGTDGIARVGSWVLGPSDGANQLTATIAGITAPVTFTATAKEIVLLPSKDTTLTTGTLQVTRLVIPAGRVVTVSGTLTINVDSTVVINGTLRGDCVGLTINAERQVTLTGAISNACAVQPANRPPLLLLVAKGGYDLAAGTVETTGDLRLTNDPTLPDDTAQLASTVSKASSSESMPPAADEVATCSTGAIAPPPNGGKAPDGSFAPGRSENGSNGGRYSIQCRGTLSVTGLIRTQEGGDGATSAVESVGDARAKGGNGGRGGKLTVTATGEVKLASSSVLRSGNGGDGGPAFAKAGVNNPDPATAEATGGIGGAPGSIRLDSDLFVTPSAGAGIQFGNGGRGGWAQAEGSIGVIHPVTGIPGPGHDAIARGGKGGSVPAGTFENTRHISDGLVFFGGIGGTGGSATVSGGQGADAFDRFHPDGGIGGNMDGKGGNGGDAQATDIAGKPVGGGGHGGELVIGTPGLFAQTRQGGLGGLGYNGCGNPKAVGGKGGKGGSATGSDGDGGAGTPIGSSLGGSFGEIGNGGRGGDGQGPGTGGLGGENTVVFKGVVRKDATGSFEKGNDGKPCPPDLIEVSVNSLQFEHIALVTPCPQTVGTIEVTNMSVTPVNLAVQVNGTTVIDVSGNPGVVAPGAKATLTVRFNCAVAASFTGQVRVTANLGTGTPTTTKTVDIAGTVKMRAVKLAQQTGPFAAGTQILQNRVINWQFGATHVPNCATDHLHSSVAGGIFIDTFGPFIDPFPMGCGFGEVILVTLPPVP